MTSDYDDTWLPPLDDEGVDSVEGLESDRPDSNRPPRRSGWRVPSLAPMARRIGGVLLVVLVGVAVWWGVQQLLIPPPASPLPTGEWSPPTTEPPDADATATPAVEDPGDAPNPEDPDGGPTYTPGQTLVVTGTDGEGIRFRSGPGTDTMTRVIIEEGAELTVLDGPDVADGYSWWHLETADGTSGWAAEDWLTSGGAP